MILTIANSLARSQVRKSGKTRQLMDDEVVQYRI